MKTTRNKKEKIKKPPKEKKRLDVRAIKKKLETTGKINLKEQKHYEDYLIEQRDLYASWRVRRRDGHGGNKPVKCCTYQCWSGCQEYITRQEGQGCHGISRGYRSHRRDDRNIHLGCSACNCYGLQEHHTAIITYMIKQYGLEVVEEMQSTKHKIRPTLQELLDGLEQDKAEHERLGITKF